MNCTQQYGANQSHSSCCELIGLRRATDVVVPAAGLRLTSGLLWWVTPRFLQIRLGRESCDQISASPNKPKRAKSCDKTAGSLFRGRWGNMGTLRISAHHRINNDEKVLILVLNKSLDICLSIADIVFWQGLPIYLSEILELGSTFFPFCPTHGAKRNMV